MKNRNGITRIVIIIIMVTLGVAGVGTWWYLNSKSSKTTELPIVFQDDQQAMFDIKELYDEGMDILSAPIVPGMGLEARDISGKAKIDEAIAKGQAIDKGFFAYLHPEMGIMFVDKYITGMSTYLQGRENAETGSDENRDSGVGEQLEGSNLMNEWWTWWNSNKLEIVKKAPGLKGYPDSIGSIENEEELSDTVQARQELIVYKFALDDYEKYNCLYPPNNEVGVAEDLTKINSEYLTGDYIGFSPQPPPNGVTFWYLADNTRQYYLVYYRQSHNGLYYWYDRHGKSGEDGSKPTLPESSYPLTDECYSKDNTNYEAIKNVDWDKDGLSNVQETELGTYLSWPDSDKDGLTDKDEVDIYKTDPLKKDTDRDGYDDQTEIDGGYNPNGPGKL